MFWKVSECLWKASFTSCANKWNSSFYQNKIDNSSVISHLIFWILREVWVPPETPAFLRISSFISREPVWKAWGGCRGRKRKERLGVEKRRKMTGALSFFSFHQQRVSHFRAWQMELCLFSHNEWSSFSSHPCSCPGLPPPHWNEVAPWGHWNRFQKLKCSCFYGC